MIKITRNDNSIFPESTIEEIGNRPDKADDVIKFGGIVHGLIMEVV